MSIQAASERPDGGAPVSLRISSPVLVLAGPSPAVSELTQRLRGLDEFVKPEFVGRMARVAQGRRRTWWALLAATIVAGIAIGLAI